MVKCIYENLRHILLFFFLNGAYVFGKAVYLCFGALTSRVHIIYTG